MAKKKKVDVDITVNDAHLEVHKNEQESKVILDSKKLDIEVSKTADNIEVKVDAQNGLLTFVGKILGRYVSKKLK